MSPGETNVADLGTKPLEPKRHQELMKQLPLAAPTCRHFLAALALLANAGVGDTAGDEGGQFKKYIEDTNYHKSELGPYLTVAVATVILVRLWDWLRSTRRRAVASQEAPDPSAGSPATVTPERPLLRYSGKGSNRRSTSSYSATSVKQRASKNSVASQAPTTYTAVRGCLNPRFLPLPEHSHG